MKNFFLNGIFFLALTTAPCMAQQPEAIDINADKKPDTVIHNEDENSFIFKYAANGKPVEKAISFFGDFDKTIAHTSYGSENGLLWLSIRFAPKYLDEDTMWFRYDPKTDDWSLEKMKSYNFNTMDPRLISTTCTFSLKKKFSLLHDRYEPLQSLAAEKKNRISEKCVEKDES